MGLLLRYHESQLSEPEWPLQSAGEAEEVQRDPRAMSDITDDEEAQLDPRKYADAESEKFLDEQPFELALSQRRDEDVHHENKYCELECGHTCNYKAASQSYLDNLIWRESEVNHYYEPKLIIDLSNWKEQQSKERADRKSKSKCEKNGLVKAQLDKEKQQQHHQGFDFDSFIAGTIRLSLQPESRDVGLLNELNTSVSQLSKSASQEKDEKCQVAHAHTHTGFVSQLSTPPPPTPPPLFFIFPHLLY